MSGTAPARARMRFLVLSIHVSIVFIWTPVRRSPGLDFQKGNQNNKTDVPFCSFSMKSGLTIRISISNR
jgi:hypothetical protein